MHAYEILYSNDISGGYYLRVEPLYNIDERSRKETDTASNNYLVGKKTFLKANQSMKTQDNTLKTLKGSFQFRYNPLTSQYVGECFENSNYVTVFESKLDKSMLSYQDNTILDASYLSEANSIREKANEDKKSHEDLDANTANFVNYGANIKLYRLIKNNIIDNEKFMEDESILYDEDEDNDSARTNKDIKKIGDKKLDEEEQDDDSYGKTFKLNN